MTAAYHFTYEKDWRTAPVAFWVHVPVPGTELDCDPPAPTPVPHKGYLVLHVEADGFDLQFSALAQLDHFIEVLSSKPLPTSKQLSSKRGLPVGPNGHWLSRLPAKLKAPRRRERLVYELRAIREVLVRQGSNKSFDTDTLRQGTASCADARTSRGALPQRAGQLQR